MMSVIGLQALARVPSPACGRRWHDEVVTDEGRLRLAQSSTLASSVEHQDGCAKRILFAPHPPFAKAKGTFSRGAGEGTRTLASASFLRLPMRRSGSFRPP